MSDWELVDISATKPESSIEDEVEVNQDGLVRDVESLHSEFWRMHHILLKLKIATFRYW